MGCSDIEYVTINPPSGMTCSKYLDPFIANAGGYLTNPDSTTACQFCSFTTTDVLLDVLFNIKYSNRWKNLGIFGAFIVFNVRDFSVSLAWVCVDFSFVDCYDLSLHVLVPHETMASIEVVQLEEELEQNRIGIYSSTVALGPPGTGFATRTSHSDYFSNLYCIVIGRTVHPLYSSLSYERCFPAIT